jgi:quercetin dioxygenase-like cupin family protein
VVLIENGEHPFVSKGWGWERWIVNNDKYCGKEMFCAAGRHCSVHYHKIKDETFFVLSGSMKIYYVQPHWVTTGKETGRTDPQIWSACTIDKLEAGESFHIPVGMWHSFKAVTDCRFIEFSTHHEDSDSYRLMKGD